MKAHIDIPEVFLPRWRWAIWTGVAFFLLLIAGWATSPLSMYAGNDSVVYRLVGSCWLRGDVPYVDIFDNKGPYLYFFEMIGEWIGGGSKWGIFILQVINLGCVIEMLYRIGHFITHKRAHLAIGFLVFALFYVITIQGGNLSEDWSLAFLILPFWLALRRIDDFRNRREPRKYGFVYGLCFGIVALIRLNNTFMIVGIVLGLGYLLAKDKRWKELWQDALMFVVGTIVAVLPMLIYFICVDGLYEAIYCQFIYNLKYAEIWPQISEVSYARNMMMLIPCILTMVVSVIYDLRSWHHYSVIILPTAAVFFCAFLSGSGFAHYFALLSILVFIMTVMAMSLGKWIALASIAILLCNSEYYRHAQELVTISAKEFSINHLNGKYAYYSGAVNSIPHEERNDIFAYNISLSKNIIFLYSKTTPAMRVSYLSEEVEMVDPRIKKEIEDYMIHNRPLWIVTEPTEKDNPIFDSMLNDYDKKFRIGNMTLYRLKVKDEKKKNNL